MILVSNYNIRIQKYIAISLFSYAFFLEIVIQMGKLDSCSNILIKQSYSLWFKPNLVLGIFFTIFPFFDTSWDNFVQCVYTLSTDNILFEYTVGWGTKAQCFCTLYLKPWFFYVFFNAELNGTIRILCFRHAIIDLLWHSRAQLGHSRSIMAWWRHKILTVPFNSALKTK